MGGVEIVDVEGAGFTKDNWGPVRIPKKGDVIELTKDNYSMYHKKINNIGT